MIRESSNRQRGWPLVLLVVTLALPLRAAEAPGEVSAQNEGAPDSPAKATSVSETATEGDKPPTESEGDAAAKTELDRRAVWDIHWNEGLRYELKRRVHFSNIRELFDYRVKDEVKLSGKIGAKLQVDAAGYRDRGDLAGSYDGVQVRRARLYTQGEFYFLFPLFYKVEMGVEGGNFVLNDVYLWVQDVPVVQTLKFGYFKLPMTLQGYESSRDITLMERASPVLAFYPAYKTGLQFSGNHFEQRTSWALGLFGPGQQWEDTDASGSRLQVTARLTGLPWRREADDASRRLLHLGLSGSYIGSTQENIRYRARPESHLAPYFVDTGDIDAAGAAMLGAEAAAVFGPYSVQAEYLTTFVHDASDTLLQFHGFYLKGSWFLTGESRPYNKVTGVFTRLRPKNDFRFKGGGWGAWELALRYSHLNLNDDYVNGGRMDIWFGGLNWYLNPTVRLSLSPGYAKVHGGSTPGDTWIVQTRFQVVF